MSKQKKLASRMARLVVDGEVTVNQGRAVLGKKPLPAAPRAGTAVKSAGGFAVEYPQAASAISKSFGLAPAAGTGRAEVAAEADWLAAMREAAAAVRAARPVTEADLLAAARPRTRPPVTKAAAPVSREDPRQVLKALKSWRSPLDAPASPARPWTPAELAMLREAEKIPDPEWREKTRSGLIARLERTA